MAWPSAKPRFISMSAPPSAAHAAGSCRSWLGVLILALLFGLASRLPGQQTPESEKAAPQASEPVVEAQSALSRGDTTNAIETLSRYLQAHPKDVRARLILAQAYAVAGKLDSAEAEFQAVLHDAPTSLNALVGLSEIYVQDGRFDQAEPLLHQAVKLSGGTARLQMRWALVLARQHRYHEAQGALEGLTAPSDPQQAIAFYRLRASIASGLGDLSAAAADMEKALALKPQDTALSTAAAVAELESGNSGRAASLAEPIYARTHDLQAGLVLLEARLRQHEDFHKVLSDLRATPAAPAEELALRQRLAQTLIANGEFAAAIDDLARAIELDPTRADLIYNLALAQFKAGRLEDAQKSGEHCRTMANSADVEALLGDIQEARGDNLGAVRAYQAAVALAPNEEQHRLSLAVEFLRHDNFDAARLVLQQAETVWPKSWRIQLALGMVEYFAGSEEQSTGLLLHAAELAPQPETALQYLGSTQMDRASVPTPAAIARLCAYSDQHPQAGKMQYYCGALLFRRDSVSGTKAQADEVLRRLHSAAALLPSDSAPHCEMGRAFRWLERWQDAIQEFEACVHLDPDSADGHYRLAQIYQHLGERERSQQEMTLYQAASKRIADQNAQRDETMKTFLYTIQKETPEHK